MIRYYAYYSLGGYKDMLLGDSGMQDVKEVFYSPFYVQWCKTGGENNFTERMKKQMAELDKRKHVTILTKENCSLMPSGALTFVTHSGFELACCRLDNGLFTVVMKDLSGEMKDEYGRDTPFMLQLIGDNEEQMLYLCNYIREHLQETKVLFSGLFEYNVELNSLQCNLEILNRWVGERLANVSYKSNTTDSCRVPVIVLSNGINVEYVAKELGFNISDFGIAYSLSGVKLHESSNVCSGYVESYTAKTNYDNSIENIMSRIKAFLSVAPEDKEDYEQIKYHVTRITNRRINR